jgi:REP element-mobilizing transposase RayT
VARPLRYLPPDCPLVEVTCRTIQGRMLLRPSRELKRRIFGVLARAAARYEVGVCTFNYLSNHCHLLLRPQSAAHLAVFMTYLNSNVAREAGRLYRWREKFWGRRYRCVPVSFEPEAQIARLRYLLSQGCKEGLVARPQDWPGATSVHAQLGDGTITGTWYDRTAAYWARKRGKELEPGEFDATETLTLCPLPCWDDLSRDDVRAKTAEMVGDIAAETRQRLRQTKSRPLGVRRILRQHPHARPRRIARSPAPRFHAATWQIRRMLEAGYRTYRDAYRDAKRALQGHQVPVHFPSHGIPPPLNLVGHRA